jgi:hypothetical protein
MASKKKTPRPEPTPQPPPFEETESEAALRRIAEAARNRREKFAAAVTAKEAYNAAKADYKKALADETQVIDDQTTELPLFPRPRAPEPKAEASGEPLDLAALGEEIDPVRGMFLSGFPAIPQAHLVKLGNEDIQTVGELEDALADGAGNRIVGLIGAPGLTAILDAISAFRQQADPESGAA